MATSDLGCAQNPDGSLRDASEIEFFNDVDDSPNFGSPRFRSFTRRSADNLLERENSDSVAYHPNPRIPHQAMGNNVNSPKSAAVPNQNGFAACKHEIIGYPSICIRYPVISLGLVRAKPHVVDAGAIHHRQWRKISRFEDVSNCKLNANSRLDVPDLRVLSRNVRPPRNGELQRCRKECNARPS
ncbi:hypothetical protein B0H13DRAFT_1876378 [Mycena leptocephala]|nr:hypothetical protein B0H13DRAFT_1876378 [Mycena leptocephala]